MQTLPTEFTFDQFQFRQLARAGDVALFEKSKPHHSRPCYEVVVVQHHPAQTIHGRQYPEREAMPPSESWGTLGWSPADLLAAQRKFQFLVTTRAKRQTNPTPFPAGASGAYGRDNTADTSPVGQLEMLPPVIEFSSP